MMGAHYTPISGIHSLIVLTEEKSSNIT